MRYTSIIRNSAIICTAALLTLTACKRNNDNNNNATPALTSADDNGGYASDAAMLESTNSDVISIADVSAAGNGSALRTTSPCATVTNDTASSPHVLVINFGSTDCMCADGKNRRGEIIVGYSGHYKDSNSVHTIQFLNYYVNDNKVSGYKTVTNQGTNSSGQVWYTVSLHDSITLASTDSVISWVANRTRTWLSGYSTATWSDDSYAVADAAGSTGTVLTRANGHVFNFSITTPLKVAYGCNYIESGIMDISSTTFTGGDRIIDYGYSTGTTGGCDNQAKLTIGTHVYYITLR